MPYNSGMLAAAAVFAFAHPMPPIMSREEWGAQPPVLPMTRHEIRDITIHHTGVRQRPDVDFRTKLRNLQAWCQREDKLASGRVKPAWPDIPYHYYIDWSGAIAEARDWRYAGDTNTEYDPTGHLLIVVEGEFGQEEPSEAQLASLVALTRWAAREHRVPRIRIRGHRDYAKTECPGRALTEFLPRLRVSF
jgi:hypothetical protein